MTSIDELREQVSRIEEAIAFIKKALIGLEASTPELAAEPKPKRAKARSTLGLDWQPREAEIEWCAKTFPNVRVEDEADKFRDYWAASGKPHLDWNAAFRNWCRKAAEFSKARVTSMPGRPADRAAALLEDNRAKRNRALDKLASLRARPT